MLNCSYTLPHWMNCFHMYHMSHKLPLTCCVTVDVYSWAFCCPRNTCTVVRSSTRRRWLVRWSSKQEVARTGRKWWRCWSDCRNRKWMTRLAKMVWKMKRWRKNWACRSAWRDLTYVSERNWLSCEGKSGVSWAWTESIACVSESLLKSVSPDFGLVDGPSCAVESYSNCSRFYNIQWGRAAAIQGIAPNNSLGISPALTVDLTMGPVDLTIMYTHVHHMNYGIVLLVLAC